MKPDKEKIWRDFTDNVLRFEREKLAKEQAELNLEVYGPWQEVERKPTTFFPRREWPRIIGDLEFSYAVSDTPSKLAY